ncbi:MAG TPA: hypothetical protein VHV10_20660 [Ktedonobacteraceae bacterium]|jgi:hypothetical protein|nr:hypothetical protein [Ktedonobacteraceae bacterium]
MMMPQYLNPELTIARAGAVLEREFRQRYGDQEYERLYRTIELVAQEHSTDQEQQVLGIIALIGATSEQANLFLALVWLAKKEMSDPTAQEMLETLRHRTVAQVLRDARRAVQKSEE